jgi:hypothetical protein
LTIIPDSIKGDELENDRLVDKWPSHIKGIPVYHLHESFSRLKNLAEKYDRIALGGSSKWPIPNTIQWWRRIHEIMEVVCDDVGKPKCKLHGLRMLDPDIFTKLPLASADSTNVARNNNQLNRFGMYVPPTTAQRSMVIAERIEMQNSPPLWRPNPQAGIEFLDAVTTDIAEPLLFNRKTKEYTSNKKKCLF